MKKVVLYVVIGLIVSAGVGYWAVSYYNYYLASPPSPVLSTPSIVSTHEPTPTQVIYDAADLVNLHPILNHFQRVIGGTRKEKWLNREEMAPRIVGPLKYRQYNQDKYFGEFEGIPWDDERRRYKDDYRISISNDINYNENWEDNFWVAGDWNALPRIPKYNKTTAIIKDAFIQKLLQKNKIIVTAIPLIARYEIDLEGDGVLETFFVVSNISNTLVDEYANGKEIARDNLFSLVILRRTIKNNEQNIVIAADYKELTRNEVKFIADLDGDGIMEFVLFYHYIGVMEAEGYSTYAFGVYDIDDGSVKKVTEAFFSPH